jgi:hypothetical protein
MPRYQETEVWRWTTTGLAITDAKAGRYHFSLVKGTDW